MARPESLSRRERQIMDVLYRLERATAWSTGTNLLLWT